LFHLCVTAVHFYVIIAPFLRHFYVIFASFIKKSHTCDLQDTQNVGHFTILLGGIP